MAELDDRQAALRNDLIARIYMEIRVVPLTGKEGAEAASLYDTDRPAAVAFEAKIYARRARYEADIVLAELCRPPWTPSE